MEQTSPKKSQEIDLLDLLKLTSNGIKSFFVFLGRAITFLIFFGLQKKYYLMLFVAAGISIGYFLHYLSRPYFSSGMVAQTNGITSSDMIGYINNLHELCLEGNTMALTEELGLPDTAAKQIKDIQAFFIVDVNKNGIGDYTDFNNDFDLKDTTQQRLQDRIHVEVSVYDNLAFTYIRKGLLSYMEKNPFLIQLNQLRINELQELIAQTEYEIAQLDSLQNTDYFKRSTELASRTSSQMMILAEKEPTMYYENKFELIDKKHKLQRELLLTNNSFTVVKDFNKMAKPENPASNYMVKSALWAMLLGYFFTLAFSYRKDIQDFIQS